MHLDFVKTGQYTRLYQETFMQKIPVDKQIRKVQKRRNRENLPVPLSTFLELNINASFFIFANLGKLRGSKKEYKQQSSVPFRFNRLIRSNQSVDDRNTFSMNKQGNAIADKNQKREKTPETGGEVDGHHEESSNFTGEIERLPLVRSESDERRNEDGDDKPELRRRFHFVFSDGEYVDEEARRFSCLASGESS